MRDGYDISVLDFDGFFCIDLESGLDRNLDVDEDTGKGGGAK